MSLIAGGPGRKGARYAPRGRREAAAVQKNRDVPEKNAQPTLY